MTDKHEIVDKGHSLFRSRQSPYGPVMRCLVLGFLGVVAYVKGVAYVVLAR